MLSNAMWRAQIALHGQGNNTTNGSIYSGEFHAGNMEGRGTMTFITNDQYVGEFKDSLFYGLGSYTWSSGTCLVGAFENNCCSRVGKKTYPDGTVYVGEFVEDQEDGRGVMVDPRGARIVGIFSAGQLVEELVEAIVPALEVDAIAGPSGEQRVFVATRAPDAPVRGLRSETEDGRSLLLFANGDKYIGGIQGGKKYGEGMYVYADGSAHKGTWREDALGSVAHPVAREAESQELAKLHDLNERNVQGVAVLKSRSGGSRTQGPTLARLQD